MLFSFGESERMWILGSIGAMATTIAAWWKKRSGRLPSCEQRLAIVITSFMQMSASVESLLVAFDLPPEKREPHIERAKRHIEDSNETLRAVQGNPVEREI
jgi:hypothetical protein